MWRELVDLDEVEPERLDLSEYAVERRPVQEAREHGVGAVPPRYQRWERRQHCGAKVAADPDRVPDGCWVHDAIVVRCQVNLHHHDQVTAVLARKTRRQ